MEKRLMDLHKAIIFFHSILRTMDMSGSFLKENLHSKPLTVKIQFYTYTQMSKLEGGKETENTGQNKEIQFLANSELTGIL